MVSEKRDYFRPLCPTHHEVMVSGPNTHQATPNYADTIDIHGCECPGDGCLHEYAPGFGYFTHQWNDDYFNVTNSSSLRITRRSTQVICGEHRDSMFIESFDAKTNLQKFRCPQKGCQQTMKIVTGGPPTYWLGSGYFGTD